ncbi:MULTISPECIES: zinc-dependent alcohol dehydrogenase family protein [unclassified Streptomyces]|uniref:zinc-dependent alcohol dehydrogenase family protein n=1 Tax=unclassified Streptomyces TaxID=2593676 RepID=UPI001BECC122|nr:MULTISPECIES: zinc-dependent alcohol dehydrogenase family protein [unclassified Streptomyces]MBT2404258.1 zinc-dependent alcohol dehydrogenase family protein [Streptomyces sp. ISL-21]MBT2457639.1 zinc-dependent alcohol dehydrogenase family protein [Streptomyces sp. ISL-86]MBT2612935.1 zinc-dependent alcohol dehydrogenase family protein [Streptomyces sp. ISL-87]
MRAVVFERYGQQAEVMDVPEPSPEAGGVVVRVEATGLCRSDWHGWMGHDPDIVLPHVPGHELAGVVEAVGGDVRNWRAGDRVTVPFICACGSCADCAAGDHQVCARQTQPGFTHWGSFAEYVALDHADVNLVAVPEELSFATAAGLGCRFATAFRAVVAQGRVAPGEWVAVHGCGGVGLSAVMIAVAAGARVIAVDTAPGALELALRFGAAHCVDASHGGAADAVRELSGGGAHLSLDALGSPVTAAASVAGLRRRGRHVQVGLLPVAAAGETVLPMERVIGWELEILGSHGMAAHAYPPMMELVRAGTLRPDLLVTGTIPLDAAPAALAAMGTAPGRGVTVILPGSPARA